MKCPRCNLINPDSALRCDCGWDFSTGAINEKMKRPTSVSVIAWILIVNSILSLIVTLVVIDNPIVMELMAKLMAKSPLPIPFQVMMGCVELLINIVLGNAMLSGRNWSRFLYLVWRFIVLVIGILTSPADIIMIALQIVGFVVFALVIYLCL